MSGSRPVAGGEELERLLLPEEAAKILNLSMSWLAKARGDGTGPEYVKLGRAVRYKRSSLLKFIQEQSRTNTNVLEH
jgi:predicted DNA-binding transcriptional regulator AlpA